jgi:hypothetical protein
MSFFLSEGRVAILYIPKFREYGIKLLVGGSGFQEIKYCPWCGRALPKSLRDEWFTIMETLRLEPDSPDIPQKYLSDEWWKNSTHL